MRTQISEFPKQPQPHTPAAPRATQPPTPLVYERVRWEYKIVEKRLAEGAPNADELNALGKHGWELTGIVSVAETARFYFKRTEA